MIYKLDIIKSSDKFIESVSNKAMKNLGNFYGIHWTKNKPKIVLIRDRQSIDFLHANKTEPWLVAWADARARIVFVLDKESLEKHSSHKYSKEYYASLIKHELSHLFYRILSQNRSGPAWLSEGVAIHTSGQNKLKPKLSKFKTFLNFYNQSGVGVYSESGFVVELLVKKFGKDKLLELIKSLRNVSGEKQFNQAFSEIYKFQISYESVNNFLNIKK